jgi:hypothetical protein
MVSLRSTNQESSKPRALGYGRDLSMNETVLKRHSYRQIAFHIARDMEITSAQVPFVCHEIFLPQTH